MTEQIFGLMMGLIFGVVLVLSGLADPDRIIAALRLKDFHVVRTLVVFILVGMLGRWVLELFGVASSAIEPAAIVAVLIGGGLVGAGIALTGYSPATALAAIMTGRIDALLAIAGMLAGGVVYLLAYPQVIAPIERIVDYGRITLPEATGTSTIAWAGPICGVGALLLLLTRPRPPKRQMVEIKGFGLGFRRRGVVVSQQVGDCLSIAAFLRFWKNLLFIAALLALLFLQLHFWLSESGSLDSRQTGTGLTASETIEKTAAPQRPAWAQAIVDRIKAIELSPYVGPARISAAAAVAFYCIMLTLMTNFAVTGGLGGLKPLCSALLISVCAVVLVIPWQAILGPLVPGALYTSAELAASRLTQPADNLEAALYYGRFSGYMLVIMLLLIFAQLRSRQWSRKVVLRLIASQNNIRTNRP